MRPLGKAIDRMHTWRRWHLVKLLCLEPLCDGGWDGLAAPTLQVSQERLGEVMRDLRSTKQNRGHPGPPLRFCMSTSVSSLRNGQLLEEGPQPLF